MQQDKVHEERSLTVIAALELYWRMHWDAIGPSQRSKVRGRLIVMAASLSDALHLVEALSDQDPKLGADRPRPATPEAWAARYLRDIYLPGFRAGSETADDYLGASLREASQWVRRRSMPLTAVTDVHLKELQYHLGGTAQQTRRTYWSVVQSFLTWAVATGRLERDPSIGMPKPKRDLDAELVDPDVLPGEEDVWALANAARERYDLSCAALILVTAFGALRIGEALALRRSSFVAEAGGVRVTVKMQRRRNSRRHADDGMAVSEGPTKGRTGGPRAKRPIFIAGDAASVILEHLDTLGIAEAEAHVFTNSRGRVLSADAFRQGRWNPLVADLYPEPHRLAGLVPHSLRHFGMTMWLRRGIPLKKIQQWGGWTSLKVMLDVYAGVFPDDDEIAVSLLMGETQIAAAGW